MLEVGILKNFDSGTHKAGVQLAASLTTYFDDISVARNIPSSALVIGNYVILAIPGGNPRDACIIATWPGGSAGSFLDLSDTPSSYSDQAGKVAKVKATEDGLEFGTSGGGGSKIQDADGDTSWDVEESADNDEVVGKVKNVEFFRGHDSGIIDYAKQSRMSAYPSAQQSIPTGVWVPMYLDTEEYDIQGEFDKTSNTGTAEAGTAGTTVHDDGVFAGAQAGDHIWNTSDDTYWVIASVTNDDEVETTAAHDIAVGETFRWFRSEFTVKEDGSYLVIWRAQIIKLDAGEWFGVAVYKNGVIDKSDVVYSTAADQWPGVAVVSVFDLSTDDSLEFYVKHDHGSNLDVWGHIAHTYAQVAKIA